MRNLAGLRPVQSVPRCSPWSVGRSLQLADSLCAIWCWFNFGDVTATVAVYGSTQRSVLGAVAVLLNVQNLGLVPVNLHARPDLLKVARRHLRTVRVERTVSLLQELRWHLVRLREAGGVALSPTHSTFAAAGREP